MKKSIPLFHTLLDFLLPLSPLEKKVAELTPELLMEKILKHKQKDNVSDKSTVVLFDYQDPLIRALIWSLKYKQSEHASELLGLVLLDFLTDELSDKILFSAFTNPLLVPIPLSKKRQRERGFNQVEWLAQKMIQEGGNEFFTLQTDALKKIKHTPNQTALSKKKRLENLKGAFAVVDAKKIEDKNIILLDDVTTTGSTLGEAKKELLSAGAKTVLCVALAH